MNVEEPGAEESATDEVDNAANEGKRNLTCRTKYQ